MAPLRTAERTAALRRTTHRLVFGGGSARAPEDVDRLIVGLRYAHFRTLLSALASYIASSTAAITTPGRSF